MGEYRKGVVCWLKGVIVNYKNVLSGEVRTPEPIRSNICISGGDRKRNCEESELFIKTEDLKKPKTNQTKLKSQHLVFLVLIFCFNFTKSFHLSLFP